MTTATDTIEKKESSFFENAWSYATGTEEEQEAAKNSMFDSAMTTLKEEFLPSSKGKGEGFSFGGVDALGTGKSLMATAGLLGVLKFAWNMFFGGKDKNENESGFGLGSGLALGIGGAALTYFFGSDIKNALTPDTKNSFTM